MKSPLTYRSYAKINLFLEVLARRPDGYHDIETIFQTVDLCDELTFTPADSGVTLLCASEQVPSGDDNLVCKAAHLLRGRTGCSAGATIELHKRIPVAAGLAGGSGNAAASLVALNTLWELGLSDDELASLGLELGSDVPYCLRGGTVAATGRGEELAPLAPIPDRRFVLVHPPLAVATAWVYTHPELVRSARPSGATRTTQFEEAIASIRSGDISGAVFNRMEPVVFGEYPELRAIRERLIALECEAAGMSGSGPTVFGVCADAVQARTIADAFSEVGATVARPVAYGVERIS